MRLMNRWAVTAVLLTAPFLAGVAHAQGAGDPFAQRHAELQRLADKQLAQLQAQSVQRRMESPAVADATTREPAVTASALAGIAEERVERARKKLLALGVDAARIFTEEGVPSSLVVVAEVESGFDPSALSVKGARGLWQFMPETARRYGLRVDGRVDERLHIARSTRAAARYLRDLHLLFGDWELALAAYNAGEQRVTKTIERAGSRAFASLAEFLPQETRRYVPAVFRATD